MEKILFFDIDGTLYDDEKKLPASARKAIVAAKEKGHLIAIATGRAPFMVGPVLEELDVDTYICFNGQYVVHRGEVIHRGTHDPEWIGRIKDFATEKGHPLVYMDAREMVASDEGYPHIYESLGTLKLPYPRVEGDFYKDHPINQVLLFCTEEEEDEYRKRFPGVKFVRWQRVCCDILPGGASKAAGMEWILEREGLTMADAIAFGDGLNDIEMLEAAGIGVAMGNGHDEAKKRADYVAGDVSEDGIARILDQLGLI
ncbi:Cof-type HAD-IIB family hydrolase [Bhargavaea cecembensis]|uniref:Cof-type HAD-IIB family hydrolase n=1 Tax=Bhargavaea cecembensis TaxID=394098 RepID=UPI00059123D1|nr:Cof-type HAD-IIB family hydrolase [Bhargavaea cecembensis]